MDFAPRLFFWQLMATTLIILCVVSFVVGISSKKSGFLSYALYTFFLLFYFVLMTPYHFTWRDELYTTPFRSLHWYSQVIYNCAYFLFFLKFLEVKKHLYTFYQFIIKVVGIAFLVGSLVFTSAMILEDSLLFNRFYIYIFVPILFCFAVYTLFRATELPGKLKYFIIFGGSAYIILSMVALFYPIMNWTVFGIRPFVFFYIGIFIEQFALSLGLGFKVKQMNQALLDKSLENQKIKETQNKTLAHQLQLKEEEILNISAQVEEERMARLKTKFEDELSQLHLASLRNQMNPHFIFNALNSIKAFLIDNEKQKAVYYLNKFSKLIRIILESSKGESIPLEKELKILKLYVNIENIRFEEKIKLSVKKPDTVNLKNIHIPPMVFQPFIENAIWHGLMLKPGKKHIKIVFSKEKDTVVMKIRDNGIGRKKSQQRTKNKSFTKKSIGLKIIRDRLKYFNQKQGLNYSFMIIDLIKHGKSSGTEIRFYFTP